MGKHKKKESIYIQGICIECNKNKQTTRGIEKKTGKRCYRSTCASCFRRSQGQPISNKKRKVYKYKKTICENCGFVPIHTCQLDVDHIDGNHNNEDPSNLRTLCANCHRLKTYVNKDWEDKL